MAYTRYSIYAVARKNVRQVTTLRAAFQNSTPPLRIANSNSHEHDPSEFGRGNGVAKNRLSPAGLQRKRIKSINRTFTLHCVHEKTVPLDNVG